MNIVNLIEKKRDKQKLTKEEINFFVDFISSENCKDYQVSAMLMAIFLNGLDSDETANLTLAMANSGDVITLNNDKICVDKHSSGGVGDTTTLILAPLVASLDVPVFKMSGRGLGFTGGTLDKLESIKDFNIHLTEQQAKQQLEKTNIVIMGQSENLTPADAKLYALRDVTATVNNNSLIASSIMSKKIATGADAIVLDVKCGKGAFMKTLEEAQSLAKTMVSIGKSLNRKVVAVISSMNEPLGMNIGNSMEVIEAVEILEGNVKGELLDVSLTLGAYMLVLANKTDNIEDAKNMLLENISNGKGLAKLEQLIITQGGDPSFINDYELLPHSPLQKSVLSNSEGYICEIDSEKIGKASLLTGAGRLSKEDNIDHGSGVKLKIKIGQYLNKNDLIANIHSKNDKCVLECERLINESIKLSQTKIINNKIILDIIQ